jgi:hypothetical protein
METMYATSETMPISEKISRLIVKINE